MGLANVAPIHFHQFGQMSRLLTFPNQNARKTDLYSLLEDRFVSSTAHPGQRTKATNRHEEMPSAVKGIITDETK